MPVSVYDPAGHDLVFAGNVIDGFADGAAISITRDANKASDKIGIGGDVVVTWLHDDRATATITLNATSASNDVLGAAADEHLIGSFLLRDRNGTMQVKSAFAWVQKLPDVTVEGESPTRAWEIRLAEAKVRVGSTPTLAAG
jgi:hypothetical protein